MAQATWKRHWFTLLRAACGLGLLVWALWRVRLDQLTFSWRDLDWRWALVALALGGLSLAGWAARWMLFLRVYEIRLPYREALRLTFYADFFNLYFLGPLGADGLRLLMLGRQHPGRRGAVVGSLVMDHVGGLFGGLLFYAVFTRHAGLLPPGVGDQLDWLFATAVIVTFLGLGVLMEPPLQRRIRKVRIVGRLMRPVEPLYAGSWRHGWLFSGFAVSWLSLACAYGAYAAAARALACPLSPAQVMAVMPLVDTVSSLPITISGLGVRENLFIEMAAHFPGVTSGAALAVSLVGFGALGIWGLLGGLALLRRGVWPRPDEAGGVQPLADAEPPARQDHTTA